MRLTVMAALVAALAAGQAAAQTTTGNAVETIIGSPVSEQEATASADAAKVVAAIDKTADSIDRVRRASAVDKVDIVFLTDAAATEGGPPAEIQSKLDAHKEAVDQLRQEIEGNAMLFHAIDSRQVMPRDVLAVEFTSDRSVTIYAAAKRPG